MIAGNEGDTLRLKRVDTTQDNVVYVVNAIDAPEWAGWDWSPDGVLMAGSILTTDRQLYTGDPVADNFNLLVLGGWPDWSEQVVEDTVDVEATNIEVTQAIQSIPPTHETTLIEGKETFVRVYARGNLSDVGGVTAWLELSRDGETLTLKRPVQETITVQTSGGIRTEVEHTFNFRLPLTDWTHGAVSFRAIVGPDHQFPEANYDNNYYPRETDPPLEVPFEHVEPVIIYYHHFEFVDPDGTKHIISESDVAAFSAYTKRAYPVAEDGLHWILREPISVQSSQFDLSICDEDITYCSGWVYLVNKIPCDSATSSSNERCFGWLPTDEEPLTNPVFGWAAGVRAVAFPGQGSLGEGNGSLIAHELGHTFGHGHPGGANCQTIDLYGFTDEGNNDLRVFQAGVAFDFMEPNTPCGMLRDTQWVRSDKYESLASHFAANPVSQNGVLSTYLDIAGIIDGNDNVTITLMQQVMLPSGSDDEPGDGLYMIQLLDASGGLLFERRFSGDGEAEVGVSFYERMPQADGVETVAIKHNGQLLATVERTANTPTVSWITDLSGDTLDDVTEVTWQADDDDGDALTFQVAYSADNGATWRTVAQDLEATSYELDPAFLTGTSSGKLRIIASDSLNSAYNDTTGTFIVPDKVPTVQILAPTDGAHFGLGEVVNFSGSAYDQEDGVLTGPSLVWTFDGSSIGAGATASVLELPAGSHIVTLTATDSDGNSMTATIEIIGGSELSEVYLPVVISKP
jgi:hypothetical protein